MENLPLISVIVPVYNDCTRIGALIEALLNQTIPREKGEIIIVDNGSQDPTKTVVRRYPVRLLEENDIQGSYAARNYGLKHARGKILAFTDSDCLPAPGWLENGVNLMQQSNADLVGGDVHYRFSSRRTGAEYLDAVTSLQIETTIKTRGVAATANLFVRREVFDHLGPFPQEMISGGDFFFTGQATASGYRLIFAEKAVVYHPTRKLSALVKKGVRVGRGKALILRKWSDDDKQATVRAVGSAPLSRYNPVSVKRRLLSHGYHISKLKFVRVMGASYAAGAAIALGLLWGLIIPGNSEKKTA